MAPISPSYSLSGDFTRLDQALSVVQPALVFAQDSRATARRSIARRRGSSPSTASAACRSARSPRSIDAAVAERRLHITADTPAKILFTSGSTGLAKGVLNTHGNLASAAEMIRMVGEPLDDQTASACRSTGCPGITPGAATPT